MATKDSNIIEMVTCPHTKWGFKICPAHFPGHFNIQGLKHHEPFKPLILSLQLLQLFRIINSQAIVLIPPPVIHLLGDLELLMDLHHRAGLNKYSESLLQLMNKLFRGVLHSFHNVVILAMQEIVE